MMGGTRILAVTALVLVLSLGAYGQATVNVSPGDDINAALLQAGAGGTVIFAPGRYDAAAADPSDRTAYRITGDLEGITLQGAGSGLDPSTASIIDGEAWFLLVGLNIEGVYDVTVEGLTFTNFSGVAFEPGGGCENVIFRDCWIVTCESGVQDAGSGAAGFWSGDENDLTGMIQFEFCVFARGGDDATDIGDSSAMSFVNCDFYDFDSDLIDNETVAAVFMRNCIFHAGEHNDDIESDPEFTEVSNSVLFDPPGDGTELGGIEVKDSAYAVDTIGEDPLYVNVGPHVPLEELDFHLRAGSPALTAGKDKDGNPTFAGSQGPAE